MRKGWASLCVSMRHLHIRRGKHAALPPGGVEGYMTLGAVVEPERSGGAAPIACGFYPRS